MKPLSGWLPTPGFRRARERDESAIGALRGKGILGKRGLAELMKATAGLLDVISENFE